MEDEMEARVGQSIGGASHRKVELIEGGEKMVVVALISHEFGGAPVTGLDKR
jgi:hypothetical protein